MDKPILTSKMNKFNMKKSSRRMSKQSDSISWQFNNENLNENNVLIAAAVLQLKLGKNIIYIKCKCCILCPQFSSQI